MNKIFDPLKKVVNFFVLITKSETIEEAFRTTNSQCVFTHLKFPPSSLGVIHGCDICCVESFFCCRFSSATKKVIFLWRRQQRRHFKGRWMHCIWIHNDELPSKRNFRRRRLLNFVELVGHKDFFEKQIVFFNKGRWIRNIVRLRCKKSAWIRRFAWFNGWNADTSQSYLNFRLGKLQSHIHCSKLMTCSDRMSANLKRMCDAIVILYSGLSGNYVLHFMTWLKNA